MRTCLVSIFFLKGERQPTEPYTLVVIYGRGGELKYNKSLSIGLPLDVPPVAALHRPVLCRTLPVVRLVSMKCGWVAIFLSFLKIKKRGGESGSQTLPKRALMQFRLSAPPTATYFVQRSRVIVMATCGSIHFDCMRKTTALVSKARRWRAHRW